METSLQQFEEILVWLLPLIIILAVWEAVWKLIALWKSARNNHLGWFICIAIINTLGILPIIYLITYKNKKNDV
jgi:hypothetical protein